MRISLRNDRQAGFTLLEVSVAIGLVTGLWISSIQVYQGLALRLIKQEQKQAHLRQAFDRYELDEQMRANSINGGDLKRDATRVPHRHRTLHSTAKPAFTN
jgi:prepilin-type N-terminal cleavage/methylation domain-containing protein